MKANAARAGALILMLGLGTLLSVLGSAGQQPHDQAHFDTPASIDAPPGTRVLDSQQHDRTAALLPDNGSDTPDDATGSVPLNVLEPGTYLQETPRATLGGNHNPLTAGLTISGGTTSGELTPAPDPGWALGPLWILLCATACLLPRRRARIPVAGLAGLAFAGYAITGTSILSPTHTLGTLLLVVGAITAVITSPNDPPSRRAVLAGYAAASAALALSSNGVIPLLAVGLLCALGSALSIPRPASIAVLGAGAAVATLSIALSVTQGVPTDVTTPDDCPTTAGPGDHECWIAATASLAEGLTPQQATTRTLEFEQQNPDAPRGIICRRGGDMLAAQYGKAHDDPHQLFNEAASPCDYSYVHGIPIGALIGAEQPTEEAQRTCRTPGPSNLPEDTYLAQCWHGVGQGMARHTNFDLPRVEVVCATAPNPGSESNCWEGVYAEILDDNRRGRINPHYQHSAPDLLRHACTTLGADLVLGCWRYLVNNELETGQTPETVATTVIADCNRLPDRQEACWGGVAEAFTGSGPGPQAVANLTRAMQYCAYADEKPVRKACQLRGINNVTPTHGSEADIDELCEVIPEENRAEVCAEAREFLKFLAGKGGK